MATVENCFLPVAILGKKLIFFYDMWMLTMVIGSYLWYVAVDFQWLHTEYGIVGYVNMLNKHDAAQNL